jgi:hypothetical protein
MFDSTCVIQFAPFAFALSALLTTFLARRGKEDEVTPSFFFSYLALARQIIALIGTVVHLALIRKDTASSTQNVALLSVRIILSLILLIYHYYWSLGKGWCCLNTSSVQWRYNTIVLIIFTVAFFGGIGIWSLLFFPQGLIGEVVALNLLTVLVAGWILIQGYKVILQGKMFQAARDFSIIFSSMHALCGIINLVGHNIPRAGFNLPLAFVVFIIGIISHFIHKKDQRYRLSNVIQVTSSNPVPSTHRIPENPLQTRVSTTNR